MRRDIKDKIHVRRGLALRAELPGYVRDGDQNDVDYLHGVVSVREAVTTAVGAVAPTRSNRRRIA